MQTLIVIIIVALAAGYFVRHIYQLAKGKRSCSCGSECAGCGSELACTGLPEGGQDIDRLNS